MMRKRVPKIFKRSSCPSCPSYLARWRTRNSDMFRMTPSKDCLKSLTLRLERRTWRALWSF